ncbi:DUF4384 domain-containing protein [Thermodesulfobacteriota bacterium]
MNKWLFVILGLLTSSCLSAATPQSKTSGRTAVLKDQAPDWVSTLGKSDTYPQQSYLVGFGEAALEATPGECLMRAKDLARADIARQLRVNIQSLTLQKLQEISGKEESFIQCLTKSTADLRVEGIQIADTFRSDSPAACYALATLNKQDASRRFHSEVKILNQEAEGLYQKALAGEDSRPTQAVNDYMLAKHKLNLARRQTGLLLAVGGTALGLETTVDPLTINQKLEALLARSGQDLDLVVTRMAYDITRAIDPKLRILVDQFTLMPGRYAGSLAWFLSEGLENRLVHPCGYHTVDRTRLSGKAAAAGKFQDMEPNAPEVRARLLEADAVLYGHYREAGERIYITAYLTDLEKGERLATANMEVNRAALDAKQLSLAPARVPENISLPPEMASPELKLRLWTDRGNGGVYREGEKMFVYVQANRACYLRLVYTQADGTNVQIFPNTSDRENKIEKETVYIFPDQDDALLFEISPPFGAEVLQVFASTEPLPPLIGDEVQGGLVVLEEQREQIFTQTRGIKLTKRDALYTEAECIVTTVAKEKD